MITKNQGRVHGEVESLQLRGLGQDRRAEGTALEADVCDQEKYGTVTLWSKNFTLKPI